MSTTVTGLIAKPRPGGDAARTAQCLPLYIIRPWPDDKLDRHTITGTGSGPRSTLVSRVVSF
jgi:hypothetical protein